LDETLAAAKRFVEQDVPLNLELGAKLLDATHNSVRIRVPFHERYLGNPDKGIVHGGLITIMLDTVCGLSVFVKTRTLEPIATLDLRIDYLRASVPERDFVAHAECFSVTRNIAFCRGTVYQDGGEPIAHAVGSFMRGTAGPKMGDSGNRPGAPQ
jgi:uncharacterized protein (TIGR00369 family)